MEATDRPEDFSQVLLQEPQILDRVAELAAEVERDYATADLLLVPERPIACGSWLPRDIEDAHLP